jgi:hypothetical protein
MKFFKGRIRVWGKHTLLAMITGWFPYSHNSYVDETGPCRMSFEKTSGRSLRSLLLFNVLWPWAI